MLSAALVFQNGETGSFSVLWQQVFRILAPYLYPQSSGYLAVHWPGLPGFGVPNIGPAKCKG
jgi:hypothetical protein